MKNFKLMAIVLGIGTLCSACSSMTTPATDARFGTATMALKGQQTRDPAAPVRNEGRPVDGLEGPAASNALDQYYKSFTKPAPPMTILNMGVLGGAE